VAAEATDWLAPGGHFFVEMSERQAPVARDFMVEHGLAAEIVEDDELGATVVHGTYTRR
jgi:release factor glutamine methyltransferase